MSTLHSNEENANKMEIIRLEQKNRILTDLLEEHKAKYNKMMLCYEQRLCQREAMLQLRHQQKMEKLQRQIKFQETYFIEQMNKSNETKHQYTKYIQEYIQMIRSLQCQMAQQRQQIHHQRQNMLLLTEEFKIMDHVLQERNELIADLRAQIDQCFPVFCRHQYIRSKTKNIITEDSSSVNSDDLYLNERQKTCSYDESDLNDNPLIVQRNVSEPELSSPRSITISLDLNATEIDDAYDRTRRRLQSMSLPFSLSPVLSEDGSISSD